MHKVKNFSSLQLSSEMLETLNALSYKTPTDIQNKSIPIILQDKDIMAIAGTGSGKTAAFAIPIIERINLSSLKHQALILSPTRELASQISNEFRRLAKHKHNLKVVTIMGSEPLQKQTNSLERGAQIIIATPGRLIDHLTKETISLKDINTLVIDEADKMLELGFKKDITYINFRLGSDLQKLMFSATMPKKIKELSVEILKDAVEISIDDENENLKHYFWHMNKSKDRSLLKLLRHFKKKSTIIICKTKIEATKVYEFLLINEYDVGIFSGEMKQQERIENLLMFENGTNNILVSTDLIARGIDIENVEMIINYSMPDSIEQYIHRVGRSARAGKDGICVSIIQNKTTLITKIEKKFNVQEIDEKVISDDNIENTNISEFYTICILGGKKDKLRAGDIVGSLINELSIDGSSIGSISVQEKSTYVAIKRNIELKKTEKIKIKKRNYKIYIVKSN